VEDGTKTAYNLLWLRRLKKEGKPEKTASTPSKNGCRGSFVQGGNLEKGEGRGGVCEEWAMMLPSDRLENVYLQEWKKEKRGTKVRKEV